MATAKFEKAHRVLVFKLFRLDLTLHCWHQHVGVYNTVCQPQTHRKLKSREISFCNARSSCPIVSQFCTEHDSITALLCAHYNDVIMGSMAPQITSFTIVYLDVYSGLDQRKHQSCASLAYVRWIHRWPVNSPHKWPVTRKCFHLMTSSLKFQNTHVARLWDEMKCRKMTYMCEKNTLWNPGLIFFADIIYPF